MSNKKIKNTVTAILSAIIVFFLIIVIAAYAFLRLYIIPKYHEIATESGEEQQLSEKDFIDFAKYLTDRQFVANLKNFDKTLAKEVLTTLYDIDAENAANPQPEPSVDVWDESLKSDMKPIKVPKKEVIIPPAKEVAAQAGVAPSAKQETAYDRITAAASKEEISTGMAILSKISVAKVNELQAAGKTDELRAYIKSCLSSAEISTSLQLYNKYKHLL